MTRLTWQELESHVMQLKAKLTKAKFHPNVIIVGDINSQVTACILASHLDPSIHVVNVNSLEAGKHYNTTTKILVFTNQLHTATNQPDAIKTGGDVRLGCLFVTNTQAPEFYVSILPDRVQLPWQAW